MNYADKELAVKLKYVFPDAESWSRMQQREALGRDLEVTLIGYEEDYPLITLEMALDKLPHTIILKEYQDKEYKDELDVKLVIEKNKDGYEVFYLVIFYDPYDWLYSSFDTHLVNALCKMLIKLDKEGLL